MTVRIPTPRLLPLTILALTSLLAIKVLWLLNAWPATMVGAAQAAGHEQKPADPPPKPAPVPAPVPAPAALPEPTAPPPVSESERAVLLELRQRRQELERRDATVATRESVLTATEQKLAARVEELRNLQSQLAGLDAARQQREDANWQSLVKVYETMKPREAAGIFNDLTMPVLLPLIGHMKEAKAAAILAAMTPEKARDVTAQLAKSKGRLDTPAPPSPPKI
jgi:flagellar motility protein MotE (MotC chaperone)